jgi:hypothetical protein
VVDEGLHVLDEALYARQHGVLFEGRLVDSVQEPAATLV